MPSRTRNALGAASSQYHFDRETQTARIAIATDEGPDLIELTKAEALAALSDAPGFVAALGELYAAALAKAGYE
jgi:hypothetical protein